VNGARVTQIDVETSETARILEAFDDALAASAEQLAHLREPSIGEHLMASRTIPQGVLI
jgi:hypothetical protein